MSDEPTAQKLRIHHLKAPDFTTKRSDGVLVLNALNGDGVQFTFYIERTPIPLYIDVIPGTGEVTVNASAEIFAMLDAEEGEGDQWHDPK